MSEFVLAHVAADTWLDVKRTRGRRGQAACTIWRPYGPVEAEERFMDDDGVVIVYPEIRDEDESWYTAYESGGDARTSFDGL